MENVKKPLTHRQRQALATQQLIVDSARDLFLEQGYTATTIEGISTRAGVAVSTVYAIYKNKRGILKAIREAWHQESGQRDIYQEANAQDDPFRWLELAAHATRRQWETGATMMTIYQGAAAADSEAAAELESALSGRRTNLTRALGESPLMKPSGRSLEETAAVFLAITRVEVYQELVTIAGWSPDAYENWLAHTLKILLFPSV
jgi:AcrR family transcriptional regulator